MAVHEMALCQGVIDIIEEEAKRHGFWRVRTVRLEIGALSPVEPEALRFGFDAVSRNTLADGAQLVIVRVGGTAWCMCCGKTVAIAQRFDPCPDCGSCQLQITAGADMRLKDLEIE